MKRKYLRRIVSIVLILTLMILPSTTASAASKMKILKTNVSGARLREGPSSSYDVVTTLKLGEKVFYSGKVKNYFAYVCTSTGKTGYVYQGYLSSYGTVKVSQIYYTNASTKIYKKASTSSSKVTTLSKHVFVIVQATQSGWGYVQTLTGKSGFVQMSKLTSVS